VAQYIAAFSAIRKRLSQGQLAMLLFSMQVRKPEHSHD
jgi:hypothetical protein